MRSLTVRIFLSFWAIIVFTIVAAGGLGYLYAERARATMENFEISEAMLEASAALRENGREGLTEWLQSLPDVTASLVYIVDERGRDILGRRMPPPVAMAIRRFGTEPLRPPPRTRDTGNLRPARPFTQLIGPDDRAYTFFVLPARTAVERWVAARRGTVLVVLALAISTAVSWLLARAISRPIRRLRESARAIAGGNLETRVADRVGSRRDEIGLLAQDFDRMAGRLQRAWLRQTELTRNVSHELRSPLARLRIALELARRKTGELPELDRIDTETGRLDDLIGQILEFSRLDAELQEERSRVDLDELLQSVVDDVRFEFGQEGGAQRLELEPASGISVDAYPNVLRSGVANVLRNAAQHTQQRGSIRVELRGRESEAVITIEDQAGGTAEEDLGRIFEPFYRSAASRAGKSPHGSGLGLAIASRSIALNDGSITARNTGRGLRVEIRLPLADQAGGRAT